jgi:hypothetical protein
MQDARAVPEHRGDMTRLRRAALIAFCLHLIAGLAMAGILRRGLDTNPSFVDRVAFIADHRLIWTVGWLTWTAAAGGILYVFLAFTETHQSLSWVPLLITAAAIGPDLAAQAIEIGILPSLVDPERFLTLHRVAVMLSGYLANGLYSVAALMLTWSARRKYPIFVSAPGMAVGVFGLALSIAALLDSPGGMFWANVLLVPAILLWLAAVALAAEVKDRIS